MDCMRNGFEVGKLLDGRFLTIAPLNHGSFGMVFTARDTLTGADVAIKCITTADTVKDHATCPPTINTDDRSEELVLHSRLSSHPNIVNLLHHFETDAHQYMVLELCNNGDLYEAIRTDRGPLQTDHVRAFMLELVDAVEHLHRNRVFHRDIKPENIFLSSNGAMKLGDFGLATTENWSTEFAVGSDRYMAPEQFDASVYGYGYSPELADIWAIGIVLLNVIFQRNPFASPTIKDPLFDDFSRDRQSLFDVFPNMSQDTYNVLVHCLAMDPEQRSLGAVREALQAAVSFTTDDDVLDDDFCTEPNDTVPTATAAREPLRTPSITSPSVGGDAFPWTGLLTTPQKPTRQLSTIPDDEPELYPGSVTSEWQYVDADEASLASNVDSGLGMSYKSSKSTKSMKSIKSTTSSIPASSNIVGSLPISFTKPANKMSSPYGENASGFSKSWSDLYEEDLEEQCRSSMESMEIDRVVTAKPSTPQLQTVTEDDRGSATPRPVLAETDVNTRSVSPLRKLVESDRAELPKQRSSSNFILDRWTALGNIRRGKQDSSNAPTPTPQKTKYSDAFSSFAIPFNSNKKAKQPTQSRDRSGSWRQNSPSPLRSTAMNKSQVWERKDSPTYAPPLWELDDDWRQHKPPSAKLPSPTSPRNSSPNHTKHKQFNNFLDTEFEFEPPSPQDADQPLIPYENGDLDGDIEWVRSREFSV